MPTVDHDRRRPMNTRQTPGSKRAGKRAECGSAGAARRRQTVCGVALAAAAGGLLACGEDETKVVEPESNERPDDSSFQKVTLNGAPGEPIGLVVLPDGRVLHTTRGGRVFLHDPATGFNRVVANIPVYQHDEEGLQGIAIDASFADNRWVYIYYSPPLDTPSDDPATRDFIEGDAPLTGSDADFAPFRGAMRLSRFRLDGDVLALGSEQAILDVPVDRGICCHVGGQIDFDSRGNLYLSTGDDSNPFESDGFAPIDERMNRNPAFDAQRSSANTNDLRGKLLRIRVQEDGTYSIPEGNLFAPGTPQTRPEIYAMGLRNAFRFSLDRRTDAVYLADYSPDAAEAVAARGPAGQGKWAIIREPGNYGWPYCATAQLPYIDYDFESGVSGAAFDCAAPVNESPRNTGLRELPRVVQPEVWYGAGPSAEFPELGAQGVSPMGGPAYRYEASSSSLIKWPPYFDGLPIFYEWSRDALFEFPLDSAGQLGQIRRLFPELALQNPIDVEFGPDGALYMLEYGDGYYAENPEAQLSRIDFVRGNRTPVPVVTPAISYAAVPPFTVQLSSEGTADPDGEPISLFWDFDQDGVVDSTEPNPSVTFDRVGSFGPSLRVVDATGRAGTVAARVIVGNTPPVVSFVAPVEGQPFAFGQTVRFEVRVEDDQPVNCERVTVDYILGHDMHGHPISQAVGCSGSFEVPALDLAHALSLDVVGVFRAAYTDAPGPGLPALSAQVFAVLPRTLAAPDAGAPDAAAPDASAPDSGAPDAAAP
jgi:cytochrome c